MIRTHKLALQEKIGEVLKVDTAAMAWQSSSVNQCWSLRRGKRRCDAGALGGRHVAGKSIYDASNTW